MNLKFVLGILGHTSLTDYLLHHIRGFTVGFFVAYLLMLVVRAPIVVVQTLLAHGTTLTLSYTVYQGFFRSKESARYRDWIARKFGDLRASLRNRRRVDESNALSLD